MTSLIVGEYRNGSILDSTYELCSFAGKMGFKSAMFIVSDKNEIPIFNGKIYLADVDRYKEFNTTIHKKLITRLASMINADYIIFSHSSYGYELAPLVSLELGACQISNVIDVAEDGFIVPFCNSKLRRIVFPKTKRIVLTIGQGFYEKIKEGSIKESSGDVKDVEIFDIGGIESSIEFLGYEKESNAGVDLSKAEIIVSVGRGVGKKDNMDYEIELARVLKASIGASRPVVDALWLEHSYQIGLTGQMVSPKLYIACGISGAIQHVIGMRKSGFIVAINKDKEAPISEIANVFVVADVNEFVPTLVKKLLS